MRLSSLEEEAAVLIGGAGVRSRDGINRERWVLSRGKRDGDGEKGICFFSTQWRG
jgi:hypothetical protein